MPAIQSVNAKEILDSRGNPTIQVTLWLDDGQTVETSVPNGIKHYPQEAFVLYDQDQDHRDGKGMQKAVALINQSIAPELIGKDPTAQTEIDQLLLQLDGTAQKSQAGANTLIAVSQAIMKAGAAATGLPLYQHLTEQYHLTDHYAIPTCLYGLVNGGQYGSGNLDIQEFLVIPASHADYRISLEIESALRNNLQLLLKEQKANYSFGELGGFTPSLQKNSDVFELIVEAARKTNYILARDFFFGVDVGAENMLEGDKYTLKDKSTAYSEKELLEYYKTLKEQYNLTYFEDPFAVKDANSWQAFTADLSDTARIAGDIITATQPTLVRKAIQGHTCNTLVVKPSQVGTISETIEAIKLAKDAGWAIVISQRTGETNDDFLADFAVGVGAEFVKFGPTNRGEAVAKYNRLVDIYKELERAALEGTSVQQPNQPTDGDVSASAPAIDDTALEQSSDIPATQPPVTNQATNFPQNTAIPTVQPPAEPKPTEPEMTESELKPAEPAAAQQPVTTTSTQEDISAQLDAPVDLGGRVAAAPPANIPLPTAPPEPAAQSIPESTTPSTPVPGVPTPSVAEGNPAVKPLETNIQQTIDSTLTEIGASPSIPSAPTIPAAAETEEAVQK